MPIFIKENQELNGNKYKIPKKLVNKLKVKLAKFDDYKTTDGYKRLKALATPSYNERTDSKDFENGNYISYGDMKTIDHDFRHMSQDPNNFERQINGGEELAQFVSNKLKSERNKVEPILKQKEVETRNKNKLKPPKNPMKPIKVGNVEVNIRESLIKENDYYEHPYYKYMEEYNAYNVIMSFLNKENLWTPLINPIMYKKALNEFTNYGYFINFPTKYIYQWMGIIMTNTSIIASITNITGHSSYLPIDSFIDFYFNNSEDEWQEYKNQIGEDSDYEAMYTFLDEKGFWDWAVLPDGSSAYSDYGIEPLYEICQEYDENKSPEEIIVLVNKALDITHCRGDLASAFIIGGAKTLSQISEV